MEMRRKINGRLVEWTGKCAAERFSGDISLVVVYGSYVNGTDNSMSDVDCFYVPKSRRGYEFSKGFILGGVGYDIFPVSWERLEGIADLNESLIPLLGDSKIIYCDTDEDMERFCALKDRLKKNLTDDAFVRRAAAERCKFAAGLASIMNNCLKPSDVRMTAGYIAMFLAEAAGFINHDYFHFGLKRQYEDMRTRMKNIPREIIDGYRNIAEAECADDAACHAMKMLEDVCGYVGCKCEVPEYAGNDAAPGKPDAQSLAELYEEIVSTFNKIYVCCETGNHILAFISAACLQHELNDAGFSEYELLADFDYRNLAGLAAAAKEAEQGLVGYIESNGGKIKRYEDFDEFERAQI